MLFRKESSYIAHKRSKHLWGEFKCIQCSFVGNFPKELLDHMMEDDKHLESTAAKCPKCEVDFPIQDMETHYQICVKKLQYKCDVCGHQCKVKQGIHDHMRRKHLWGIFKCTKSSCRFSARFAKDIIKHIEEKGHNDEVECPTGGCSTILPSQDIEAHYEKCLFEDMRQRQRISRKKWSTNRICDICGNNVMKDNYSKHVRTCKMKAELGDTQKQGDIESYCCEQCGKEFSGKYASNRFVTHKKNHHLKEQVWI